MDRLLSCLRAAADSTRLRLLALCAASDMNVSDLRNILGQSQPRVSRHLKLLCEAGLLDRYREGSWIFYRLADDSCEGGRIAQSLIEMLPNGSQQLLQDRDRLDIIRCKRSEAAEDYFRENAERWDTVRSLHVEEEKVEEVILDCFPNHLNNLLDIGTGTGRMLQLLSARIDRGIGIDTSRDMLAVARANLGSCGIRNCHVRLGDMYRLELNDESFDGVVIHQVLHYSDNPGSVIIEASRILQNNGLLVVVDFLSHNQEILREKHAHMRLGFSDKEIADWFQAAKLVGQPVIRLEGSPLTVSLWTAIKNQDQRENNHEPVK
ncbi:MAG: ArsR family transcriptional regulator [Rhodospirillaceae bacterium]|nr:ArsR family transcriptional regulator [Rhodospirillaceae bacterium]